MKTICCSTFKLKPPKRTRSGAPRASRRITIGPFWAAARSKKTKENTIWGWQRISQVAATQMYRGEKYKQKFNDVFHQARYNIALSLYQKAMTQSGEKRGATLQQAETTISSTYSLYPAMGGKTWKPQYDRLLRRIQKGLGKKNGGLESLNLMAGNARR